MYFIDNKVFEHEYLQPLCWGRYQDDCFGLWTGSLEKLRVFTSYLSSISSSIKFTVQYNCHQLEFLDVLVKKENGLLETTVYSKKTDGHIYLLPSSYHFHTVSKNIPYGIALRLKRICSTETEFNMESDEYQNHLIARGHSKKRVRKQFHKASLMSREVALTKTPKNHNKISKSINIEQIRNLNKEKREKRMILEHREDFWILKLRTLQPYGLNYKLNFPQEVAGLTF